MPYYKWGWHLAQSANLFYAVIFTKGFYDGVKVNHNLKWSLAVNMIDT